MFGCPKCKATSTVHRYATTDDPYVRRTCADCGYVYPAVLDKEMAEYAEVMHK